MSDRVPGIQPRPSLWRRLDIMARYCVPGGTTLLLVVLATAPFGLPGQAQLQPALTLSCVFFWSLFRPLAMSAPVVFAIGLFADLLGLAPVGVSMVVLLAAHGLALVWRRGLARQGFLTIWAVFGLVAFAAALAAWALTSLLLLRLLPVAPALFQFVLSAAVYPAVAAIFLHAHRGVANPEGA
jgi:rod shape-determining protein MreD